MVFRQTTESVESKHARVEHNDSVQCVVCSIRTIAECPSGCRRQLTLLAWPSKSQVGPNVTHLDKLKSIYSVGSPRGHLNTLLPNGKVQSERMIRCR